MAKTVARETRRAARFPANGSRSSAKTRRPVRFQQTNLPALPARVGMRRSGEKVMPHSRSDGRPATDHHPATLLRDDHALL
eukprot:1598805-Pleurochrysis_carterae.AAC.1